MISIEIVFCSHFDGKDSNLLQIAPGLLTHSLSHYRRLFCPESDYHNNDTGGIIIPIAPHCTCSSQQYNLEQRDSPER